MKNIWIVMRKELLRVFKDKTMLIGLILPGILIFIIYSFMGSAFTGTTGETAPYNIVTVNLSSSVEAILVSDDLQIKANYTKLQAEQAEIDTLISEWQDKLKSGEIDILILFDKGFDTQINNLQKPGLSIYYNPFIGTSSNAYVSVSAALQIFQQQIFMERGIDVIVFSQNFVYIYDEKSVMADTFAKLLPMLIISFLFSGCMSLASDLIAGEKERGTIATILITPIKRSQLALGKVFSLSILALISAASSFLGVMFSLPKMMGVSNIGEVYGFAEFALLFLVLASTILLIIGLMSVISSFAKSTKEASMLILPFMMVSILVGLLTFVTDGAVSNTLLYLIPIFNSVQAMVSILSFDVTLINLIVTFIANFVYMGVCVYVLTNLFKNEKVMFSK